MIEQLYYHIETSTDPFHNLAVERYLLEHGPARSCVLYLWQNANTVVIGKNQNCWQECRQKQLEQDGGVMVRRLSGGGAVYHDLGNLNFTFLLDKADYDVPRQLDVILQGLQHVGIEAEKSGRNDILAHGRKFSGNAFYEKGSRCYHHGTLMVQVDKEKLGKYLQVSASKLASKGVASVQSRVVNLTELQPDLTIPQLQQGLIAASEGIYGLAARPYPAQWIGMEQIGAYEAQFRSDDWRFGQRIPFTWELEHRFVWGGVQLQCHVAYGKIVQPVIYSDAMDGQLIEQMAACLQDCPFDSSAMAQRLRQIGTKPELLEFCQYVETQNF